MDAYDQGVIRPARVNDVWEIAEVQRAAWRATYEPWIPRIAAALDAGRVTATWIRAIVDPSLHVAVAVVDGKVVGYALSGPPETGGVPPKTGGVPPETGRGRAPGGDGQTGERVGELHALYAHPDVHGCGLGRELVTDALAALAASGRDTCLVWTVERNERARGFYEHLGFELDPDARRLWNGLAEVRYRRAC